MEEMRKPNWEVFWVDTEEELEFVLQECEKHDLISLDVETADWRKGPQHDYLALIQLGIPALERTFLIDAIAFTGGDRNKEEAAFAGLKQLLENTDIEFIIQYAPFEERHFKRSNVELSSCTVSDTRVIAKKLHPYFAKYGLQDLARELLEVDITKGPQTSDWAQRPLTQAQIDYAALDPEITYLVYKKLKEDAQEVDLDVSSVEWAGKGR